MKTKSALKRLLPEPDADVTTIGGFLRAKRLEFDMTQEEVATRAGISKEGLSNIETGRCLPRRCTLDGLKKVLGNFVVPSHLISESYYRNNKGVPGFTKKRTDVLGRFVTKRRIELRLIQEQLAKRLGVSRVVIARVEIGTYMFSKKFLDKLAIALECEIPPDLVRP